MEKKIVLVSWTVHPFKERPFLGTLVVIFLLFLMASLGYSTRSTPLVIVGTFFFLVSLSSFFFPTRYFLCSDEVVMRGLFTQREPWEKFFRYIETEEGVVLSPLPSPGPRDNYRGVYLRLPPEKREEILEILRQKILEEKTEKPDKTDSPQEKTP